MVSPPLKHGQLAVVTGASSGIGAEFAKQLAAEGYDLLLIARRTDRLLVLADSLRTEHGVDVTVLTLDLALPDSASVIRTAVEHSGKAVKWLINNAGYGLFGRLDDFSLADHEAFVRVLGLAPIETSLRLLPALRLAAPSHLVNVASLAAFLPGIPGAGLYPGVKSLLLRFTETLAAEERKNGVSVTASCPGLTATEIFDHQPASPQGAAGWMKPMAPGVVVGEAIRAARAGKVQIVHGALNWMTAAISQRLPASWSRSIIARAYGQA